MSLRRPAGITSPEITDRRITVAEYISQHVTTHQELAGAKQALGMGLHIGGDQAQCIPHHWIVLECVLVEHVDEFICAVAGLLEHLVHLGHSVKVHTLSQFFFSLAAHPLTQHGTQVSRRL